MPLDIFLIASSIALIVLAVCLVVGLFMLNRSLLAMGANLAELRRELVPMLGDLRTISLNVAIASESLSTGMERVNRMADAIGNLGDDLETGRRAVKGGLDLLGAFSGGSWLSRAKSLASGLLRRA